MLSKKDIAFIENKYLDVPFADESKTQKLDIYLPPEDKRGDGSSLCPTVIFFHGGAFKFCDKRDNQVEPYFALLDNGYAVVSVGYRLSGEATYPAAVDDCRAAVNFLCEHAEEYGLDSNHFALAGQSAGAYLALLLATENLPINCVVSWYAPTDIPLMYEQLRENGIADMSLDDPTTFDAEFFGDALSKIPAKVLDEASPLHRLDSADAATVPPLLLQHGKSDNTVPWQQAEVYYNKAHELGLDITLEYFEGADHIDTAFETNENLDRVAEFLNANI